MTIEQFAALFLVAVSLALIVWFEIANALDRRRRRLRREGWRAHRDHMDSLEPKRWTR
jgi:hypothetical protein